MIFSRKTWLLVMFLFCTVCAHAWHFKWQDISAASANSGVTQTMLGDASGQSYTINSGTEWEAGATNDITIYYSTNTPVTTPGPIQLDHNTLTFTNGPFSFTGDQAAARVTLENSGSSASDASGFDLSLLNNTVSLTTEIKPSTGSIYGALFQTQNSAPGVGIVDSNEVKLTTNAKSENAAPNLIGGAIIINADTRNITSQSNVTNNQVTVNITTASNPVANNIFGGQAKANLSGNKTFNLTSTVDGNSVTLTNGKFSGVSTGGAAIVNTDEIRTATLQGDVQNNLVTAAGGTYNNAVLIGGHAAVEGKGLSSSSSLPITVHDNAVTLTGGTFNDTLIIGGATTKTDGNKNIEGAISNNTVTVGGTASLNGKTTLVGGYTTGTNSVTNNTLVLQTSGHSVYGVDKFNNYQFAVAGSNANETFLTVRHGNGHNQDYFLNYENTVRNGALDLTNANIVWKDNTLPEDGRPANLQVGQSVTLINQTGYEGTTGTIANNGVQEDIVSGTETYSYKLVQNDNTVRLLHNGFATTGNWTQDVIATAGEFAGGDTFTTIGGTLTANQVSVASNASARATLTANTLDVSAQNTTLTLTNTNADEVKFNTITVGDGYALNVSGNGLYSFDNMTIDGAGSVTALDAFSATNNVTLTGGATPNFSQVHIGSGSTLSISGGTYTFDELSVYGNGATLTGDLNANGKKLNFYLADTTTTADTALTVSGNADITDSTVKVGITGTSSPLRKDDQVVLVDAASAITGEPVNKTGVGMQGLFLVYDFDVDVQGNQLIATVTKAGLNEESKSFLEGRAASLGLISGQGADFVTDQAMDNALQAAAIQQTNRLALFSAFGGGKSRYETGSHVDVDGFNAVVGLSHNVSIFSADFMLASFVEYGRGSYNSYNTFSTGELNGSGDTDYMGLGAMGRWLGKDNTYIEGSLRGGHVSTDFKAHVFFANQDASYDYGSFYYGAHVGMGYIYDALGDSTLDFYAKYLFTQQQAKNVTISSGDRLRFSDATSSRARVGVEANLAASASWQPRLGVAYDYEFNGKANASAYGMSWDAPSLKGGTGVGHVSLAYLTGNWIFDLGAEGYMGQREGFVGNFQIGYKF